MLGTTGPRTADELIETGENLRGTGSRIVDEEMGGTGSRIVDEESVWTGPKTVVKVSRSAEASIYIGTLSDWMERFWSVDGLILTFGLTFVAFLEEVFVAIRCDVSTLLSITVSCNISDSLGKCVNRNCLH